MAAVAPAASTHLAHSASPIHRAVSSSEPATLKRMTSRKLFGRSRKAPPSSSDHGSTAAPLGHSQRQASGNAFTARADVGSDGYADDKVFGSHDSNLSTSALSTTSTASRTSRFFRRFGRQKPPPVPSLPPALVLDLDAGTALPRSSNAGVPTPISANGVAGNAVNAKQRKQHPPSAAAAIIAESNAAYAAAESVPKPKGLQRKKMLEALTNARLDVSQARDLVRMCGLHIRERGLDTSGLFRPFRIAESQDHVYHMIQLFLLSIDVSTYISVFPILPENALDRFGHSGATAANGVNNSVTSQQAKSKVAGEELDKELRYATPHDVVSVMKWGLRHVRLRTSDFNSKDADEWYDVFVASERESGYHARAIADLLHPKLPQATAELLSEVLDLMASVAAHSSSNHMPASALCKVLGFWLFGRIGVAHPPPTVNELIEAVNRTSGMAEHLLLAHIRSQAAVTFSMPLRLTELVQRYPYIKAGGERPCLPPAFATRPVPTLRIDMRSDNLIVSQTKPRAPSSTLADALDASASDDLQGGQGEMWAAIMTQLDHLAEDSKKGYELLIDEHVRILRQVDQALAAANEDGKAENGQQDLMSAAAVAAPPARTAAAPSIAQLKASRRRSRSLSDLRSHLIFAGPLTTLNESNLSDGGNTPRSNGTPKRKPVPLIDAQLLNEGDEVEVVADRPSAGQQRRGVEDSELFSGDLEPSASWRSFSEEGFGGISTASSELSLSEFDLRPVGASAAQTLPSRRSNRSLYRVRSSTSGISRRKLSRMSSQQLDVEEDRAKTTHTVTSATLTRQLDTSFAVLWQDQLLDPSPCCRLPQLVFVQLNPRTAKAVEGGERAEGDVPTYPGEAPWLLVVETVIPPRPPTPPATARGAGEGESDRKSIFAPSIRSVRMRLRRVSTVIGTGMGRRKHELDVGGRDGEGGEKI
ncbi:hypothetical protein EX895_003544 [Sporisorium graminicola]|uniref:Rho-GAP domain-containing protein n=1 Tax=Sporisorium graminicola TaxID=280036 RepID=A0A4U7KST6_9BASI|nr:hypothetical protein EX895_003544 [Sporisorium graminicola]TKY87530.1 hypothetical protein EX895_003544 [Sporisorium graminicola]